MQLKLHLYIFFIQFLVQMQFEQNIFIFHRAITKLPKHIFRIGIFIVMLFFVYETYVAFDNYCRFPVYNTSLETVLFKLYQQNNEQYKVNRQFLEKYQQRQKEEKNSGSGSDSPTEKQGKQKSDQTPQENSQPKQQENQVKLQQKNRQVYKSSQKQQNKAAEIDKQQTNTQQKQKTSKQQEKEQSKTVQKHFLGLRKLFPQKSYLKIQIIRDPQQKPSYSIRELPLNSKSERSEDDDEQPFQTNIQYFLGVYMAGIYAIPKNKFFQSHGMKQFVLKIRINNPRYLFANEEVVKNQQIFKTLSSAILNVQKTIKYQIGEQIASVFKQQQLEEQVSLVSYFQNFAIDRFSLFESYKNTAVKLKVPFTQVGYFWEKPIFLVVAFANYLIIDVFMAIFIRYGIVAILTVYMILGGSGNFRWYQQYRNILNNRQKSCSLKLCLAFGITCTYGLISYGCWWVCSIIYQQVIQLMTDAEYYSTQFIKIIFFAELCHFLFMHTRTSIYFYSSLSYMLGGTILFSITWERALHSQYLLSVYILLQIMLVLIMLLVEKSILQQPFHSDYKPTLMKPRMLFFMGYDLTWEKGIPPLWTTLIKWFDWSYVKEKQGVYIDRDYRLLYGMLLGMNERQPLPQDEQNQQDAIAPSMNNQSEVLEMRERHQEL